MLGSDAPGRGQAWNTGRRWGGRWCSRRGAPRGLAAGRRRGRALRRAQPGQRLRRAARGPRSGDELSPKMRRRPGAPAGEACGCRGGRRCRRCAAPRDGRRARRVAALAARAWPMVGGAAAGARRGACLSSTRATPPSRARAARLRLRRLPGWALGCPAAWMSGCPAVRPARGRVGARLHPGQALGFTCGASRAVRRGSSSRPPATSSRPRGGPPGAGPASGKGPPRLEPATSSRPSSTRATSSRPSASRESCSRFSSRTAAGVARASPRLRCHLRRLADELQPGGAQPAHALPIR